MDGEEGIDPGKLYVWNHAAQEWVEVGTCSDIELTLPHPAKQLAIDSVDRASKN